VTHERHSLYGLGRLQLSSRGFAAAAVELQFEVQLLALMKRRQARSFYGRDVHEHVVAAVFGLDEAKAFWGAEPLYGTGLHSFTLSDMSSCARNERQDQIFRRGS
jgi:hypothetical protein